MSHEPIIEAIINRRVANNLSREEVAKIAGLSLRTYARIENGEADMHFSQYRSILRALKISDLDITLDVLNFDNISEIDIFAATRPLSQKSRRLLVKFLLSLIEK